MYLSNFVWCFSCFYIPAILYSFSPNKQEI
ncbi:hypothetical protein 22664BS2_072 [Escherichia phage vB_EcoS-22664BS2]|nr:hypothetical protein QCF79_gp72 [Escherichia phage vB_EcoS-22664BS2]QZI78561.1 hypothetical protein 22664BS2_072 [Escherichia phage vB_EcoS-22664BS2]